MEDGRDESSPAGWMRRECDEQAVDGRQVIVHQFLATRRESVRNFNSISAL
jgi:hypothetical protein